MNDYRGTFSKTEKQYLDRSVNNIIFWREGEMVCARHFNWSKDQAVRGNTVHEIKQTLDRKLIPA